MVLLCVSHIMFVRNKQQDRHAVWSANNLISGSCPHLTVHGRLSWPHATLSSRGMVGPAQSFHPIPKHPVKSCPIASVDD
eukprot:6692973-Ditylum_brightwellii.AAC.1